MTRRLKPVLAGVAAFCLMQTRLCAQPLEATSLCKDTAHGCRTLDLANWSHPTRQALERAQVEIRKVELCNRDVYPIFTVRFRASPMLGVNDAWFNALYDKMIAANGFHSFSFVDPGWGVIASVDMTGKREATISYDEFDVAEAR